MYNFMFLLEEASNFCEGEVLRIFNVIAKVIFILKIAIPIIIVLLAMLDLGKAVMAGDDKQIKEAQGMLIKRLIYGVVIFFVVTVVQVVFGLVNNDPKKDNAKCWNCAVSNTPFTDGNVGGKCWPGES